MTPVNKIQRIVGTLRTQAKTLRTCAAQCIVLRARLSQQAEVLTASITQADETADNISRLIGEGN